MDDLPQNNNSLITGCPQVYVLCTWLTDRFVLSFVVCSAIAPHLSS